MDQHKVKKLVFSSSATVYGADGQSPLDEQAPTGQGITNPYGWTKYMQEQMIRDLAVAEPEFEATILRYFNPVGAHPSGQIGEDPYGIPNNLLPFVAQVAVGKLPELEVFGGDYATPDGTCQRDYIHVMDLAAGHVKVLESLQPGVQTYNLGTGKPESVLDVIRAFEKACGRQIPYKVVTRRPGDPAVLYASVKKAAEQLGWRAGKTLQDACKDAWNWQSKNPNGYSR